MDISDVVSIREEVESLTIREFEERRSHTSIGFLNPLDGRYGWPNTNEQWPIEHRILNPTIEIFYNTRRPYHIWNLDKDPDLSPKVKKIGLFGKRK